VSIFTAKTLTKTVTSVLVDDGFGNGGECSFRRSISGPKRIAIVAREADWTILDIRRFRLDALGWVQPANDNSFPTR